ncbi:MAG TPA: hypothetical protein VGE07_28750 [Herpetosiphonaceae bacterium]
MPEFTLWTPDEMKEREKPKRLQQKEAKERAISEFASYFQNAGPGFGGQLVLSENDDKRKLRALVREAASRHNLSLRFRPIKDKGRIEFSVVDPGGAPKKSSPPAGKGRGRPKKG